MPRPYVIVAEDDEGWRGLLERWLSAEDWRFPFANLVGAGFIIASLIADWNLAAFVMEVFWVLISIYGLAQSFRRARR